MVTKVLNVILPMLVPILLGMFLRKKQIISQEGIAGMKTFVMRVGIPGLLFHAYLTCSFSGEIAVGMATVFVLTIVLALIAFAMKRTRRWNYNGLPMMFAVTEGGLGVPLILILFGMEHTFRMASLDLAQTFVGVPLICILSAAGEGKTTPKAFLKKIISVPVAPAVVFGLGLNFLGVPALLEPSGVWEIVASVLDAIAAPVSTLMLLSVGYEFGLTAENRRDVLTMSGYYLLGRALFCLAVQGILCLLPGVSPVTRWTVLLFSFLPPSFLSIHLGKNQKDNTFAANNCSICTFATLLVFCIIAIFA